MRFAIVVARFNRDITEELLDGAERILRKHERGRRHGRCGSRARSRRRSSRSGSRQSGTVDAVICLGAVIRGETAHFEYVAGETAAGITRAALDTGVPVIFGVLTVDDREQARDRLGGKEGHKGEEAALTAIEMVSLLRGLP